MGGLYSTPDEAKPLPQPEKEPNPNSDIWSDLFGEDNEERAPQPARNQEFRSSIAYSQDLSDALANQYNAVVSDTILRQYVLSFFVFLLLTIER